MGMFTRKLSSVPEWSSPYLVQLRSDSTQVFFSIVQGIKRTLHLYERASIEDFLRYIYYFDHRVEHVLLQSSPKKFQSIAFLIDWLEEYPTLKPFNQTVSENCSELTSRYAELSRTVHGTRITDHQTFESLNDLSNSLIDGEKELSTLKAVYSSILFLLSLFHINDYRQLPLDEKSLVNQILNEKQIDALSGLRR
jgi:hypothetical protein